MQTETSKAALRHTNRPSDRQRVLEYLKVGGPSTTSEVAKALGKDGYTASKTYPSRMKELVRMGLVEVLPDTRTNRNGNEEHVNALTRAAEDLFATNTIHTALGVLGKRMRELEQWRAEYLSEVKEYAETLMVDELNSTLIYVALPGTLVQAQLR